jgi:alkaline phosphatase D
MARPLSSDIDGPYSVRPAEFARARITRAARRLVPRLVLGVGLGFAALTITEPHAAAVEQTLVTVGDVTARTAVVWARAQSTGPLTVEVWAEGVDVGRATLRVTPDADFTGKTLLRGLQPATRYRYRIVGGGALLNGEFVTAPANADPTRVVLLWSGDLGSRGRCRRLDSGYPIFRAMAHRRPDFFLFVGDSIYAEGRCRGPEFIPGSDFSAKTLPQFHAKHRYNREDAAVQAFFRTTSVIATWDDNEVASNFAGPSEPLMPVGRRAFLDYWPILPAPEESTRIYRNLRWGRLLELFVLDTRQYRSPNCERDGPEKSMLGARQREWLINQVATSGAVWKVIVSSVPLTVAKGWPCRDAWPGAGLLVLPGRGFATERDAILRPLRGLGVRNLVVLTADVHYAASIHAQPTPGFALHELIAGPLSARPRQPWKPDPSLQPRVLFARGGLNNFGEIMVEATQLLGRWFDEEGRLLGSHVIEAE